MDTHTKQDRNTGHSLILINKELNLLNLFSISYWRDNFVLIVEFMVTIGYCFLNVKVIWVEKESPIVKSEKSDSYMRKFKSRLCITPCLSVISR